MIKKWIKKLLLKFNPPKTNEIYGGDAFDFVVGRPLEKALHGLTDKYGNMLWDYVPGGDSYRLKIVNTAMPYYVCEVEVLVSCLNNLSKKKWLKRRQDRRIAKALFHDMVAQGILRKLV